MGNQSLSNGSLQLHPDSNPSSNSKLASRANSLDSKSVNLKNSLEVNSSKADSGVTLSQASSVLLDYSVILSLVLGGCCANVWSYEQLLIMNPRIGSALTFSQMVFITLQSLPSFLIFGSSASPVVKKAHNSKKDSSNSNGTLSNEKVSQAPSWLHLSGYFPRLKPRQVPLTQWASQVVVHTAGSLLNNWAFAFNVPLTVMIVFRSAGLAVSMLLGFFVLGRRYSVIQMLCVIVVSLGAILATLSKTASSPSSSSSSTFSPTADDLQRYFLGISMVVTSLLLTGILGVLQEKTYRKYGPCWQEGVFYTHLLSLPIFIFLAKDIKQGLTSLNHPQPSLTSESEPGSTSMSWLILGGNLVTQLICVSGVNRLTSRVSSVSTNLVLTTRKAISLCISVWWFGSGWNFELALGACMVFVGSLMFSLAPAAEAGNEDGIGQEKGKNRHRHQDRRGNAIGNGNDGRLESKDHSRKNAFNKARVKEKKE